MKKFLCILLMFSVVLSMAACGPAAPENMQATTTAPVQTTEAEPVFMAGYCKMDITPAEFGVPIQGFSNGDVRLSAGLYTYLYATTLAVRDTEGNTALIISVDSGSIGEDICKRIRQSIFDATGIPVERIMISSIHQHSTPAFGSSIHKSAGEYRIFMEERILQSAKDALEDLAPAQVSIATVETEGLTFVKHYLMNDGTYCGDLYGSTASGYKAHESEADNDLQLVKFDREGQTTVGGKKAKNILMSNFQGHPHTGTSSNDPNLSADAPGIYREAVEAETGYHVMYVSGAQGNLNMSSRITEENKFSTYKERGEALAKYAIKAVQDDAFTPVNTGKVQGAVVTYEGKTDHSMDDLVPEATKIDAVWKATYNSTTAMKESTSGRVHSVYHATAILDKAKQGPTKPMPVIAISFGDIAICGGMYEMFDTNGMEIKEGSPFAMTFTAHMANGAYGYIPSLMSYENGCYPADITRFAKGTGEELRDVMLQMLKTQHEAQ